ncbi:alpha-amylase family glycosyl hydrolase [Paenibacillus sediminis]|uniref:Alpha-amylase n=1 Tax=Paenibacillus sediminis TaxID=664909 RepID=A0ABS4H3A7_9BACL|nr:alpha-amylase family glycosyl hydrolase [Paenibacillus sediminis]MBP1936956.1 glycosidase [Paenibacillus sediminis]
MSRTASKFPSTVSWIIIISMLVFVLSGCEAKTEAGKTAESTKQSTAEQSTTTTAVGEAGVAKPAANLTTAPMGKSSGVFYEIFVRSFYDSDGNGIGDFNGITQKLDYLAGLGIQGIWLMPINPSPSYHGYDVTDYYGVNPDYGTMDDFTHLLDEAHKRGIKVIMDLVVNHSSNKHPWFVESAKSKDNPKRDWYIWAEDKGMSTSTLGAWGQQPWQKSGKDHYLGIFWEGMPDMNFDNPEVRAEFKKIGQYWLKMGVDGFRLDAAKHVYEDFQSSVGNPEVAKKNQEWWQEFRKGLDQVNKNAYMVGEVWDSAAVIGPYLNQAFNSAFDFDIAGKIVSAARTEQGTDLGFTLSRVYDFYSKQSGGQFVDAPFLTNHDQNRVMTELRGNVDHAKMAASILLTLPGNPFIYYGEEIGMKGAKPDERIREPMLWSDDSKAVGQTTWELALNREGVIPVDKQLSDSNSLLNHYKELISWRKQDDVLQDGGILSYKVTNPSVMAYVRILNDKRMLVVHNLSVKSQSIELQSDTFGVFEHIVHATSTDSKLENGKLELAPYSTTILQ